MSRITGTDAFNMMEAYNAVYAPQELAEEQVWEEVEAWVNSLVEEGYDLSEYTWEDMYEEYLNEMGQTRTTGQATAPISNAPYQSRFARPMNAGTPQQTGRGTAVSRPQIGSLPSNYRGAELQQTARARASQVGTTRQGTAGGPTTGGNTPIGTSPTRSVAQPPARPAAAKPAPTAKVAPAAVAPAKPAATPAAAPAATSATPTVKKPSLASQAAELRSMQAASRARQGLTQSFDVFDVIKGHLLDEGYADTEEAALQIMANMSEEWRQDIMEISQKTATSAYAQRRTGEFEGDDAPDRVAKTNKLKGRIEKKFGAKAGEHADRAADVQTFGRKDASGRRKQSPQPRIQTSDHENQREFKRELRIRRDRRLRAARGEDAED